MVRKYCNKNLYCSNNWTSQDGGGDWYCAYDTHDVCSGPCEIWKMDSVVVGRNGKLRTICDKVTGGTNWVPGWKR